MAVFKCLLMMMFIFTVGKAHHLVFRSNESGHDIFKFVGIAHHWVFPCNESGHHSFTVYQEVKDLHLAFRSYESGHHSFKLVGKLNHLVFPSHEGGHDSFKFVRLSFICVQCKERLPGFRLCAKCGSVHPDEEMPIILARNRYKPCPKGTFSPSFSRGFCHKCTNCEQRLQTTLRNCTPTEDSVCGACRKGYYRDQLTLSCLPCSHCCGTGDDDVIKECVTQQPRSNRHCSFLTSSRCTESLNPTLRTRHTLVLLLTKSYEQCSIFSTIASKFDHSFAVSIILNIFLIFFIFIHQKKSLTGKQRRCFTSLKPSKKIDMPAECKSNQSNELEDFSKNDVISGTYSFNCGVSIKYDQDCKQDRYKNLIVETLSDKAVHNYFKSITKLGQIFLSPIYKFYSQGEKFENEVEISLPHSALWSSEQENWDMDILCMDERKGKEAKWERITDGLEVNWKDVSFKTDTLLTYAVVGKPLKEAKKRMQFVLFTTSEMISDLFHVCMYLLDDNESSYQTVLKEASLKGFTMLGSPFAAFVDCYNSVEINLNVESLLDGWELNHLNPKTILSSVCKESYFSIPSFQAVFRRVKRYADKFSCKFRIMVAEKELILPAFAFVPEEKLSVLVDVHDQDYDTSVIKEKKTLFKDLHYDTLYVLGRMLDVSRKGQGTWRQLARDFGLADDEFEQFSVEYRTLEGSPGRALFEYLNRIQPNITVGEFAKCLESLGREDAMAVLYKHLKKKQLNSEV